MVVSNDNNHGDDAVTAVADIYDHDHGDGDDNDSDGDDAVVVRC